jgi:hypothetical protein
MPNTPSRFKIANEVVMNAEKTAVKAYCNVMAIQKGLDPAGHAGDFEDSIVIEIPLPWNNSMYSKAGALPQEVLDLFRVWLQRYHEGKGYPHRLLMVAPDTTYTRPCYRRVMFYTRQPGAFAQFDKTEYLVPDDQMGALVWALYEAKDDLPRFDSYRVPEADAVRDVMVCTHGTVDVACAKFGYPLFRQMRKTYTSDMLRVWRVSHFGGHVFAPTLIDMPIGHSWAYVEETQAAQIIQRSGDVRSLRGHYRGWAGLEGSFLQAAEREMWQCEGWDWFTYLKSGQIIVQDTDSKEPRWGEVQLDYRSPTQRGNYRARVEIHKHLNVPSNTDDKEDHPHPQYLVSGLRKVDKA